MGLLSKFEGKMEDTVEGAADRMGAAPLYISVMQM